MTTENKEPAAKTKASDPVSAWLKKGNNKYLAASALAVAGYAYYVRKKKASGTTSSSGTSTGTGGITVIGPQGAQGAPASPAATQAISGEMNREFTTVDKEVKTLQGQQARDRTASAGVNREFATVDREIRALQAQQAKEQAAIKALQNADDKKAAQATGDGSISKAVPKATSGTSSGLEAVPASTAGGKSELTAEGHPAVQIREAEEREKASA
ncbi:MAG: hypothetical protein ACLQBX_15895 [Candidatus Limnocylindrales bacterium]